MTTMQYHIEDLHAHLATPIPDDPDLAADWHSVTVGIVGRMWDMAKADFRAAFAKGTHTKGTVSCHLPMKTS